MDRVQSFVAAAAQEIAQASARLGARVALDASVLDRDDSIALAAPGAHSANRSARMIRARDGCLAVNLPRDDDLAAAPALIGAHADGEPWDMLSTHAPNFTCAELTERAALLGLALAQVGETPTPPQPCAAEVIGKRTGGALNVIDFSALWAGPLCGSVFAAMGAEVVKLDTQERPDPTPHATPALDRRLNGAKRRERISIARPNALFDRIAQADVLITSARARALDNLGLSRARLFAANPSLIWIAVTGHGWRSNRIAFGDDAAAAGGLVAWHDGAPHFIGDALADPLTGLAAAAAALGALERGQSAFIDASLAHTAAYVAALKR
jgi:hypothetical protein